MEKILIQGKLDKRKTPFDKVLQIQRAGKHEKTKKAIRRMDKVTLKKGWGESPGLYAV